jgi:uncharacterized protein YjbI with pentapeptide repeats
MIHACLNGARLHGTNLSNAFIDSTTLVNLDFRAVRGLAEVNWNPCPITLYTVQLLRDESTLRFLRRVGVPEIWIDFYYSTLEE